jgi:hypothetical protein
MMRCYIPRFPHEKDLVPMTRSLAPITRLKVLFSLPLVHLLLFHRCIASPTLLNFGLYSMSCFFVRCFAGDLNPIARSRMSCMPD